MRETTHTLTLHNGRPLRITAPDTDVAVHRAERAGFKVVRPRPETLDIARSEDRMGVSK